MFKNTLVVFAFVLLSLSVSSQEQPGECGKPVFAEEAIQNFPDTIPKAQQAFEYICSGNKADGITAEELTTVFTKFHMQLVKDAQTKIPGMAPHLDIYRDPLLVLTGDAVTGLVPDYLEQRSANFQETEKLELYKQGHGPKISHEVPSDVAQACFSNEPCMSGFIGYMDILKKVYSPLGLQTFVLAGKSLSIKDYEWNGYIEESRSQTMFDIAFTTFVYEKTYGKQPDVFASPPKVQWFLMHPSITIENVNGALDGDESKEALAIEIVGFNYWQDACFGYACGASLIVNYADRNGIDDQGWGVMFHVDNSYSFGVTKHGSETGFFISVDLLKLFQDKKSSFTQYQEKFRKLGH